MIRRILPLGGILASALALAPAATAAPGGSFCALDGSAKLTPGLTANEPAPGGSGIDWGPQFTYSFHGDLTNCTGGGPSGPGGPASGKIYAGEPVTIGGTAYEALPKATGNGGCTGSHTEGTAIVLRANNTVSVIDYSTDGAAAAVGLQGGFRSGQITPADPTLCTSTGVVDAPITGVIGHGNYM